MPSPIAHTIVGSTFYFLYKKESNFNILNLVFFVFLSSLPDFEFFYIENNTIHFSNIYHRGFTHSIFFAFFIYAILSLINWLIFKKGTHFILFLTIFSHCILDLFSFDSPLSENGYGIKLFWPFSDKYFISPFTIFQGIDSNDLTNISAWKNVLFDFILIIPCSLIIFFNAKNKKRANQ